MPPCRDLVYNSPLLPPGFSGRNPNRRPLSVLCCRNPFLDVMISVPGISDWDCVWL